MATRLKDIALDLGVSVVTVSKVLRGNRDIGDETRQRVLQRMKELNYQPNMIARGLASGKSSTVGLVVPDLIHPFFAEFAKALGGVLRDANHALLLASSEENFALEQQEIRTLLGRGVDVLILASCRSEAAKATEPSDGKTPVLLFDRNFAGQSSHFVGSNDVKVGELATQHLLDLGRRRIAHIGGELSSPAQDRMRGYRNALNAAGIAVDEQMVIRRTNFDEQGNLAGAQAMQELLRLNPRPDAVFCYNDLSAIGAMQTTLDAGLAIPGDIAFVGCGNVPYADYLRVPLTSIDHFTKALGKAAGEVALDLAKHPEQARRSILIEPALVVRASSRTH